MNTDLKNRSLVLVGIAACLLAIWPLPNSIGFRHLFLLAGGIFSVSVFRARIAELLSARNYNLWIFFAFYIWLVFHYFVLSTNVEEQWYDLKGDWLRALFASLIGLATGLLVTSPQSTTRGRTLETMFVAGLSGTVVIYVARYLLEIVHTGQWIHTDFYMEPFLGKTPLVVFGSMFLCGIFARISLPLAPREKLVWYAVSALGIFCVGVTYYFSNTKNGFLVFLFIFAVYAVRTLKSHSRRKLSDKIIFVFILLALAGFLKIHIASNPSWLNFYADVQAGHDIEHNQNWKNAQKYPLPTNERGKIANGSTYERSAWGTAGVILVGEHPLGYGLINHSFGALALEKWPDFYKPVGKYRHASHSGWLDFTLGFGLPGLALVLLPLWIAFFRAAKQEGFWFEYVRWSVPVVTIVYTITEVCTGHFIEFLFFYIALISGITAKKKAI